MWGAGQNSLSEALAASGRFILQNLTAVGGTFPKHTNQKLTQNLGHLLGLKRGQPVAIQGGHARVPQLATTHSRIEPRRARRIPFVNSHGFYVAVSEQYIAGIQVTVYRATPVGVRTLRKSISGIG